MENRYYIVMKAQTLDGVLNLNDDTLGPYGSEWDAREAVKTMNIETMVIRVCGEEPSNEAMYKRTLERISKSTAKYTGIYLANKALGKE